MKIITPADKNFFLAWYDLFKKLIKKKKISYLKNTVTIVPMAGKGQRFFKEGYYISKPFIKVTKDFMVNQAIKCLPKTSGIYFGRLKSNNKLCTICNQISSQTSYKENEIFDFITSIYSGKIIKSWRENRLEIDIYLPELGIGFEFNGIWWHSDKYKKKDYHKDKINFFKDKGIRIIYIWEDDWIFKNEIIKSQIKNWLNITESKIFARKCKIEIIDNKIGNIFLNENHIQGSDRSILKIGLFYKNELVGIMTFNKSEGRKKMCDYEWNLSRFCNKLNTNVVGGASKILTYFIEKYKVKRIVSYADKDWSIGNLYHKIGFNLISESNPDYKYVIKNKRKNKANFKKSNLKTELTESEYMKSVPKIWDSGKMKFEMIIK